MGEVRDIEEAKRAVQELGALLSTKPHSRDPDLRLRYILWFQNVERVHADIRDALDRAARSHTQTGAESHS